eukprot:TRINITY_DN27362_c0_g2_i1.p1 TRINITY_DN27362_c0_g2~~TRINITY_DN27362_c0_g2_i1.p1  ORF type:complete len:1087 (+),score=234.22 TRINITY_DN27362_c0_g2_i1:175-3435(+)
MAKHQLCTQRSLVVAVGGEKCVRFSAEAVCASPVLQMLAADELGAEAACEPAECDNDDADVDDDDRPHADEAIPMHPPFGRDASGAARALRVAARVFLPGGLPLALRWEKDNPQGLAEAVAVLHCAQFLDMRLLVDAACDEIAHALAHQCADSAQVAELFFVKKLRRDDDEALRAAAARTEEAQRLVDEAKTVMLGTRALLFAEAWSDAASPLSALPSDAMREVLHRADVFVRSDNGVKELLASVAPAPGSPTKDGTATVCADGDLEEFEQRLAQQVFVPVFGSDDDTVTSKNAVCYSMDVVVARWQRYSGSVLLLMALAAHATAELADVNVRIRAIGGLKLLACECQLRLQLCVLKVLLDILAASRYAGGALLEGSGNRASSQVTSPTNNNNAAPPAAEATAAAEASSTQLVADAVQRMGIDGAWQVRIAACEALEALSARGHAQTVAGLTAVADHGYFEVRAAVAASLGRLASPSDAGARAALVTSMGDDDWRVRDAACKALVALAVREALQDSGPGSQGSVGPDLIYAMCEKFTHKSSDVRRTVRTCLWQLMSECDTVGTACNIVPALCRPAPGKRVSLLRRPVAEVRGVVIEALGDALGVVAEALSSPSLSVERRACLQDVLQEALGTVSRALADKSNLVRKAAAVALGMPGVHGSPLPAHARGYAVSLAADVISKGANSSCIDEALEVVVACGDRGNQAAVDAVLRALEAVSVPIATQKTAAAALAAVAAPGDLAATAVMVRLLDSSDTQDAAFRALEQISLGSADDVNAIAAIANDKNSSLQMKRSAMRCLARTAQRGSAEAMDCAISALDGTDSLLRAEAISVVVRTAEPGDVAAKALVAARLGDDDTEVQRRAVDACASIVERGDVQMVTMLVSYVVGNEFCLRQMALKTVQHICGLGDRLVLDTVLPWCDHGNWPTRHKALEALGALALPGDEAVLAVAKKRITDADKNCRQTACEVLGKLAEVGDQEIVDLLLKTLEDDSSWLVRDAAGSALAKVATEAQTTMLHGMATRGAADDVGRVAIEALEEIRCRDSPKAAAVASGEPHCNLGGYPAGAAYQSFVSNAEGRSWRFLSPPVL